MLDLVHLSAVLFKCIVLLGSCKMQLCWQIRPSRLTFNNGWIL